MQGDGGKHKYDIGMQIGTQGIEFALQVLVYLRTAGAAARSLVFPAVGLMQVSVIFSVMVPCMVRPDQTLEINALRFIFYRRQL
jgi:hypothetical protein